MSRWRRLYKDDSRKLAADKTYAFAVRLKPGLVQYRVEFGTRAGGRDTLLHTVTNLVCGDAYLIDGQSNALATDTGEQAPPYDSAWIRSYGTTAGDPQNARMKLWGNAVWKDRQGEKLQLGYWGMELAKRLVESQKIPICIINGAVGGTLIEMHQRSPAEPTDVATIYGRMLWRVQQARLTHGIRGVLWHQGENNQGAAGASGRYGWETYQQYFVDMSAAWKEDFPNLQHYYVFQIWPNACSMGGTDASQLLPYATPEQVRAQVRKSIDEAGRDGRLWLGSSTEIHPAVKLENVLAMWDEIETYGYYAR